MGRSRCVACTAKGLHTSRNSFRVAKLTLLCTQVQETRGKGELLGEASFFFRLRHINTAVVAEGSTMLFVLSYDDYQQLSSAYVTDAAAVMEIIIDLVNDSGKAGKSQGSSGESSANEAQGTHLALCFFSCPHHEGC